MFLIAEVSPFTDGNGRIARTMTNAELAYGRRSRIIIPTAIGRTACSCFGHSPARAIPIHNIRMLNRVQQFASQGDFNGYEAALITLRQTIAFLDPDERRLSYAGRESAGGRTIIAFYLVI